jgi:hypothetical protein
MNAAIKNEVLHVVEQLLEDADLELVIQALKVRLNINHSRGQRLRRRADADITRNFREFSSKTILMKVIWSLQAKLDLDEIYVFLEYNSPRKAFGEATNATLKHRWHFMVRDNKMDGCFVDFGQLATPYRFIELF